MPLQKGGVLFFHEKEDFIAFFCYCSYSCKSVIACHSMVQVKREGGIIMEFKNAKGIFLQIADSISEKVMEGKYPPGEKIPSVRDLATEMGVNPNTVMRTYSELQTRGIIENKRGVGYYVNSEAVSIIHKWKKKEFFRNRTPFDPQTDQDT